MKDNRHLYNYNYFHQSKNFQTHPERTKRLVEKILEYDPNSVLDVGTGLGAVVNELLNRNVIARGIDFAPILKKIWGKNHNVIFFIQDSRNIDFPDNSFDLVFSSDFFEHIDEEDIDKIANEMKRVGNKVITFVADDLGGKLNRRQREFHPTHKSLDWWKEKLRGIEVFSSHDYDPIKP